MGHMIMPKAMVVAALVVAGANADRLHAGDAMLEDSGVFTCPTSLKLVCVNDVEKCGKRLTFCTVENELPDNWTLDFPGFQPDVEIDPEDMDQCSIAAAGTYTLHNPLAVYKPKTGVKISLCKYDSASDFVEPVLIASSPDTWRPQWFPRDKSAWPMPDVSIDVSPDLECTPTDDKNCNFVLPPPSPPSPPGLKTIFGRRLLRGSEEKRTTTEDDSLDTTTMIKLWISQWLDNYEQHPVPQAVHPAHSSP